MIRWSRFITGFALILLILAWVDATMRYRPEQILAGQPFIYVLYVGVFNRLYMSVAWVFVVGAWVMLRHVLAWVGAFKPLAMVLLTVSCGLFSLVTPLIAFVNQNAVTHLQAVQVGTTRYNVYFQPEHSFDGDCAYVLVQCQNGVVCQYMTRWYYNICVGDRLNYQLNAIDKGLQITLDGEIIATYTAER